MNWCTPPQTALSPSCQSAQPPVITTMEFEGARNFIVDASPPTNSPSSQSDHHRYRALLRRHCEELAYVASACAAGSCNIDTISRHFRATDDRSQFRCCRFPGHRKRRILPGLPGSPRTSHPRERIFHSTLLHRVIGAHRDRLVAILGLDSQSRRSSRQ